MILRLTLPFLLGAAIPTLAADEQPRRPRGYFIAPGTPATVGQGGAVIGVVPHHPVPAPQGAMSTFGGLLGTGAPQAPATSPAATPPAATPPATASPAPR